MSTYSVVGKPVPRIDGWEKVTGQALFGADVHLPGMLYGKILGSAYAHADILSIDTTEAEALPGVVAVVTAADLPEEVEYNPSSRAHSFLARDRALFVGQPVAAVAAEDPHTAEEALELIKVRYRPLPPVLDPLEAMREDSPLIRHRGEADHSELGLHTDVTSEEEGAEPKASNISNHILFSQGDVEKGLAEADVVLETTYRMPAVHQGYLEPQVATAHWDPITDRLAVWVSTQGQFFERAQLAEALGLPLNRIKVVSTEIGGGFGGKFGLMASLTALLARKAKRPVQLSLTRREDLQAANPAPENVIELTTGAKKDGTLTALKARVVYDTGAYSSSPMAIACVLLGASYKIPHLEIDGYEVLTNKASAGAYRAPGAPNACFAIECQMDMVARKLGMDPLQFRLKNAAEEGTIRPDGQPHPLIGLKETINKLAEHPIWTISLGKNQGRGVAIGGWGGGRGPASAMVKLEDDGSVDLIVGSVDLTGTDTALAQIVAEVLKVSLDRVKVTRGDTDSASFAPVSGGSQIIYAMGGAVLAAAQDARQQIMERAAQELEEEIEALEMADGRVWCRTDPEKELSFARLYELSASWTAKYSPIVGRSSIPRRSKQAPGFAATVADVEVDAETGQVTVLRVVVVQDVGFAINPMAVEGQMQGGTVQGLGMALSEELVFDERGYLQNPNLLDYRQPTASDVPFIKPVIVEVPSEEGPFGAKQVGEPSAVPAAAAIANAVYDAVGVRITELPITPEKIVMALEEEES
ncbi:MAG: xanthine dehydrogenase family protein molybdopterin-binding subunit [Anaerolineae bacterium]